MNFSDIKFICSTCALTKVNLMLDSLQKKSRKSKRIQKVKKVKRKRKRKAKKKSNLLKKN